MEVWRLSVGQIWRDQDGQLWKIVEVSRRTVTVQNVQTGERVPWDGNNFDRAQFVNNPETKSSP